MVQSPVAGHSSIRLYLGGFIVCCLLVVLSSFVEGPKLYGRFNSLFIASSDTAAEEEGSEDSVEPRNGGGSDNPNDASLLEYDPTCFAEQGGSNVTTLVTHMHFDPCYRDRFKVELDARDCGCLRSNTNYGNKVTYMIPAFPRIDPVTNSTLPLRPLKKRELAHSVIFAFIHLNKAGGTTIKKEILIRSAIRNEWDGAAFGSFAAWKGLGERIRPTGIQPSTKVLLRERAANVTITEKEEDIHRLYKVEPLYIRCGEMVSKAKLKDGWVYKATKKCRLRVVWGALTMGLCDHFPGIPCVYFTVLRNPVDRAISNYNYVCIQGAENRKKWLPEWKENNYCPLTLLEFFDQGFIQPNKLIERATRSCDDACGIEIALENLKNPCMRYLLLDQWKDGLEKLRDNFGPSLRPEVERLLSSARHRNRSPYNDRVMNQIKDPSIIAKVKEKLALDIKFYDAAKALYEEQWAKPLVSCNHDY